MENRSKEDFSVFGLDSSPNVRVFQAQASEVHHGHRGTSSDEDEQGYKLQVTDRLEICSSFKGNTDICRRTYNTDNTYDYKLLNKKQL